MEQDEKSRELEKYRDLVLAVLDYDCHKLQQAAAEGYPNFRTDHAERLKVETRKAFEKQQLSKLKQWFRDLTEGAIETRDFAITAYLKEATGYEIDIFAKYFARIDAILTRRKITTDNQFYDASMLVDHLCQSDPVDEEKIDRLNRLIGAYEDRNSDGPR
ncbi:MAG: hypothetical protein WA952_21260 [Lewinella sp.]